MRASCYPESAGSRTQDAMVEISLQKTAKTARGAGTAVTKGPILPAAPSGRLGAVSVSGWRNCFNSMSAKRYPCSKRRAPPIQHGQNDRVHQADSWLAAAYALNGETSRAADALAEARKSSDYPASIAQYRRRAPLAFESKRPSVGQRVLSQGIALGWVA
jgi:hypothetical protein